MTLGCAAVTQARAESWFQLEAGLGVSHYDTGPDGRWYQQGMQHDLHLSAPVLMAGFTGPLYARGMWGIDWHIDYVYLAHMTSQCECTPVDANYNPQTHALLSPLPVDVPNANFVGSGNAQGVALTIEPYVIFHEWRIGIEGGIFPYRPDWNETVYNWTVVPGTPQRTVTADTPHAWQLGAVAGLSVGRGPFSVSYQHYYLPGGKGSPAIWTGADVLMVRYRF